jgi:hypothetical protein
VPERDWRLDEGPEWDAHRIKVDPNLKRFEENFLAARYTLERDPLGSYTRPIYEWEPRKRVFTTRDFMEGFELTVIFEVFEANRSVELQFVYLRPLTPEEAMWGV